MAILGLAACSDDDATCGDGVAQGNEQCDLTDLKQMTCADVVTGSSGTLACNLDCTYNTDGCALCGDGVRNFGEQCDCGTDAANLPTGCMDVNGGTNANCSDTCEKISMCGDGTVDSDEDCDCGTDAANLPTGCPDVNGGTDANCDADCTDIVECAQDEWFGDCNALTIGDCCPDEWDNPMECQTLNLTTGAQDLCMLPCDQTSDCYWGTFCETQATTPICWPEICSTDTSLGWPNTTPNAPCTVTDGGEGWCWPIFSRDDPTDGMTGYCVENGTLAHGDTCPNYPLSASDRSEQACNKGMCDGDTGAATGVCKQFCDWEKRYANAIYDEGVADTLGACPANSNCFSYATIDLDTGLRSGDAAYCEDDKAHGGYDTCSLVTGQLLSDPTKTCATDSDYTNGVCGWITFVDANNNPVQEGTGGLIGICADGQGASTLALWDACDSSSTTDFCPPQSLCLAENVFGAADGQERCLPMCDTENAAGPVQHCLDIFGSVSTGSATTTCQTYSLLAGGDGPNDQNPTRLGICAPLP